VDDPGLRGGGRSFINLTSRNKNRRFGAIGVSGNIGILPPHPPSGLVR